MIEIYPAFQFSLWSFDFLGRNQINEAEHWILSDKIDPDLGDIPFAVHDI
jgi:hypothetical protein